MRDIVFRAKVKRPAKPIFGEILPDGAWVYGELHAASRVPHIHDTPVSRQPIDPETVGQFTGIVDKNGNRIFEGDIVKVKSLQYGKSLGMIVCGIIIYDRGCFWVKRIDAEEIKQSLTSVELEHDIEVIGNIYDNPELLKGGER